MPFRFSSASRIFPIPGTSVRSSARRRRTRDSSLCGSERSGNTVSFFRQQPSAVSTSSPKEKLGAGDDSCIRDDAGTNPECVTVISADEVVLLSGEGEFAVVGCKPAEFG